MAKLSGILNEGCVMSEFDGKDMMTVERAIHPPDDSSFLRVKDAPSAYDTCVDQEGATVWSIAVLRSRGNAVYISMDGKITGNTQLESQGKKKIETKKKSIDLKPSKRQCQ